MNPNRRRPKAPLAAEALESRALLTGGAGNSFALMPATITRPGGTTAVTFTIDSTHFTPPTKGKLSIGIDVVSDTGSKIVPVIRDVKAPTGAHLHLQHANKSSAYVATLDANPTAGSKPRTYTIDIGGLKKTSGAMLVGLYLTGDANGDGTVTQADVTAVNAALGGKSGDAKYSFDADMNRDGRITKADVNMTKANLGAKTTILPVITADLAPANGGTSNRISRIPTASFRGIATPGTKITYAEVNGKSAAVTTTADTAGNYGLVVPLAVGSNTFKVTAVDPAGQTISGNVAPVIYTPLA